MQPEIGDEPRQRQKKERRRHEIGEKDADAEILAGAARRASEAVAGGDRDQNRDRDHAQSDQGRIPQPLDEQRVLEQIFEVLKGGSRVEPVRIGFQIVEVAVSLEGRDQHPIERKGGKGHKRDHGGVERAFSCKPPHQPGHLKSPGGAARATER